MSCKYEMESDTLKTKELIETECQDKSCFENIYQYKFQDNEKFMEGWKKVRDVIVKEKLYDSLVKAEVYFYSREVQPVDFGGYRTWLWENTLKIQDLDALLPAERPDQNGESKKEESPPCVENENVNDSEIKCADSVENKGDVIAKHPANFIELIEMIQSGMKLPDTEDLNIEPLNIDPTPCDTQRPKKPWENS